jgi:hypothetical protein
MKQPEALRLAALIQSRYGNDINDEAAAELRRLHAENEKLRADAERYRWLRGEVQGPHTPLAQVVWKRRNIRESGDWTNLSDGQALDAAIDAARKEGQQ